jgi:hypothetical protein
MTVMTDAKAVESAQRDFLDLSSPPKTTCEGRELDSQRPSGGLR